MPGAYEVEFKRGRRDVFLDVQDLLPSPGDYVIVQADRGEDMGRIVAEEDPKNRRRLARKRREILRMAITEEAERLPEKAEKERDAFLICRMKIVEHGLRMKLVDVEYQFDGNKICFYYTAERRVDFRELVKDLAAIYRTRIDMRQIGVRDEARRLGGHGLCGRPLCCSTMIRDFEPISSQVAKNQHLSLSPNKISGVCGRLMCCLLYEEAFYQDVAKRFPKVGSRFTTERGRCEVCKLEVFHDRVCLRYEDGTEEQKSVDEVNTLGKPLKKLFKR